MKRLLTILCGMTLSLAVAAQVTRTERGVTFVVDGELPYAGPMNISDGEQMAQFWITKLGRTDDRSYVASSFRDTPMTDEGEDVLFRTMIEAFAYHYSLELSPDMIWLNICQVFDKYVNDHAEELRDKFVCHDEQMSLAVQTGQDIFSPEFDWEKTIDGFIQQIGQNTKGGIADVIVADFTTTTPTTRIASGVTLMDVMKNYFEYVVMRLVCGIPSITLTGTPDDWRSVLRRTEALEKYGMKWWTKDLKPILKQFIRASEGKPDVKFWKNIVMLDLPDRLRGAGCSGDIVTSFDGWFTKLFPYNKDGKLEDDWSMESKMLSSMVSVPFRYKEVNDNTGAVERDIPMNLIAGFVGARVDEEKRVLTPEIGWMVRQAESEEDILAKLNEAGGSDYTTLSFRVNKELPEVLRSMKRINRLNLIFMGKQVVVPEWFDAIEVRSLYIEGKMTPAEVEALRKRFPQARIRPI